MDFNSVLVVRILFLVGLGAVGVVYVRLWPESLVRETIVDEVPVVFDVVDEL